MAQNGLGIALRWLRERKGLSLREAGGPAAVDHAYLYRLENGDKASPSRDVIQKILKEYNASEREAKIVNWLCTNADINPDVLKYSLDNDSVEFEIFTAAAGMRHRGTVRPNPATLIERVRRAFEDD